MAFQHKLYQIFYGVNKFDKISDILSSRKNMLTKDNAFKWLQMMTEPLQPQPPPQIPPQIQSTILDKDTTVIETVIPIPILSSTSVSTTSVSTKKTKNDIFYSTRKNPVFWSVYLGVYGMSQYMLDEKKYANVEMQERQKMLDYFRDTSNALKLKQGNNKVSNVLIQEITADIAVANRDPNSVFHLLIAMCVFYKKTIYFVRKNKYLVFSYSKYENEMEDLHMDSTLLLYMKNDKECGIFQDPEVETIRDIIENKYRLESYEKPMRGISSYKVCDLEDISRRLDIDLCDEHGVSLKKADLYNKIASHARW
jgi:hypothetical protein